MKFNEDSRVKIPTILHLMNLGYTYIPFKEQNRIEEIIFLFQKLQKSTEIDNSGRNNFTIAHELGHYFLQHQLHDSSVFCTTNDDPIEREAIYFASCFLVPKEKVKSAFPIILENRNKNKIKDFLVVRNDYTYGVWKLIRDELTKRFGVSEAALRYRLQQLKLAKFEFG